MAGLVLDKGLNLTVQFLSLFEIERGIHFVQKCIELLVTEVR